MKNSNILFHLFLLFPVIVVVIVDDILAQHTE